MDYGKVFFGTNYGGAPPTNWQQIGTFSDAGMFVNSNSIIVGLSWRIFGTSGGTPDNFAANEFNLSSLFGSTPQLQAGNNVLLSGLVLTVNQVDYIITNGGNVVGATFIHNSIPNSNNFFNHTLANNSPSGSSFTQPIGQSAAIPNVLVNAASNSAIIPVVSLQETATGTLITGYIYFENILPPRYIPETGARGGVNSSFDNNQPNGYVGAQGGANATLWNYFGSAPGSSVFGARGGQNAVLVRENP